MFPHKVIAAAEQQVMLSLALASEVEHSGENGRAREAVIRRFLRSFIPASFGVDTGFVVDSSGATSRQVDIIIHRTDYHPVWEVGGVKYFLIEAVAAVIENKAWIESSASLNTALANIDSVKSLDVSAGGSNDIMIGPAAGGGRKASTANKYDRPWGAIIAQKSLARATFIERYSSYIEEKPRHLWPDMYVDVNEFATLYMQTNAEGVRTSLLTPDQADSLAVTVPDDARSVRPLVDFARQLADRLRHAPLIDFQPERYFTRSRVSQHLKTLPR